MSNVNKIKYFALMILLGIVIGILNFLLLQMLEYLEFDVSPNLIRGAIVGASFVAVIALINRSIRRGGCRWLLNNPDG